MLLPELAKLLKRPLLSQLVLGLVDRPCERCGCLTLWAKPRQYARGFCPEHALLDGPGFTDALTTVLRAFPGSKVSGANPDVLAPGEYGRREVRLLARGRFQDQRDSAVGGGPRAATGRRAVRGLPAQCAPLRP